MIRRIVPLLAAVAALSIAGAAQQQSCSTAADMDAPTKGAISSFAERVALQFIAGNTAGLQQVSTGPLATDGATFTNAGSEFKANLTGARATTRSVYLLNYNGQGRPEFYCGIFNSPDRTGFLINGITPGNWAIAIEDISGGKSPMTLAEILQQQGGQWRLAGFYPRNTQMAGHDSNWYLQKARDFKARGETHNAWFYYLEGWELAAPLDFMSNVALDKIADEMNTVRPTDLPSTSKPVDLMAGGKTFQLIGIDTYPVGDALDLRVRYKAQARNSDTSQLYQDNIAVMNALVAKYPEYRDGFPAMIARAIDSSGTGDYGSISEMSKLTGAASATNTHP